MASRRRRILHVIPTLWSGAGDALTHLCELQSERAEVTVVSSARRGTLADWPAYRRRLRAAGVRHVSIDTFARTPEVLWRSVERLRDLARTWAPDVASPAISMSLSASRADRIAAIIKGWSSATSTFSFSNCCLSVVPLGTTDQSHRRRAPGK